MKKILQIGGILCSATIVMGLAIVLTSIHFPIQVEPGGAIRGVSADSRADIVLGKRSFGETSISGVLPNKVSAPGGVVIDRSGTHPLAYIWDSNNSRIIGINLDDCYAQSDRFC